jgi:uncharacterized membrane protein YraQ (UPF0718 family)/copper chaperone CopZ
MSPYLLFGFLIAGFLSVFVPPALVERHLGGKGLWPVVKAAIFGVPLPLCSCGVIPVAASLRRHGANKGATTAFLISTPQTGVDSILVTYSLMGLAIAVFRPIAAFVSGLLGGAAVTYLDSPEEEGQLNGAACEGACCVTVPGRSKLVSAFEYGFVTLPRDIGKALLVGVAIAGLITAIIPDDLFSGLLGTGITGMLVMMGIGIPMYVCATASVPVAAALMAKGVSAGAAIVFLMTGPATNAATIATIWKVMGKRTAGLYLAAVAVTALASGFIMDGFLKVTGGTTHVHVEYMGFSLFNTLSAFALLAILGAAAWTGRRKKAAEPEGTEEMNTVLAIEGMHCDHCASAVERALSGCAGVECVKVDFASGKATVTGEKVNADELGAKVKGLGYTVRAVEKGKTGTGART